MAFDDRGTADPLDDRWVMAVKDEQYEETTAGLGGWARRDADVGPFWMPISDHIAPTARVAVNLQ